VRDSHCGYALLIQRRQPGETRLFFTTAGIIEYRNGCACLQCASRIIAYQATVGSGDDNSATICWPNQ
jgi:hypothetical protein